MNSVDKEKLLQYVSGTLPAGEEEEIEKWIDSSDENKKTLEEVYLASQITDRLIMMKSVDARKSLSELDGIINDKQKKRKLKKYLQIVQRTAAVLFIPALILAALWYPRKDAGMLSYIEVKANRGTTSSFVLPDSTAVWLNAGSTIRYPAVFSSNQRLVNIEGEALFIVKKNPEKPFIVQNDSAYAVEVIGTTFNISAYNDDDHIETTLISGSVKVKYQPAGVTVYDVLLKPNEKAIYSKSNGKMEIVEINGHAVAAWKNGHITFENHPMSNVIKVLSRHYNIRFNVLDERVYNSAITATFKNDQLSKVLQYIEMATGIKYRMLTDEKTEKSVIELYMTE